MLRSPWRIRHRRIFILIPLLLVLWFLWNPFATPPAPQKSPTPPPGVLPTPAPDVPLDFDPPSIAARASAQRALDAVLLHASTTPAELRQVIFRDFEPYYQAAATNRSWFREMVHRGQEQFLREAQALKPKRQATYGLAALEFKKGKLVVPPYRPTNYADDLVRQLNKIAPLMPNFKFLLNGRDEPRVVFNTQEQGALARATESGDPLPFHISPSPSGPFFKNQSGCDILSAEDGFVDDIGDIVSFFISSASTDFTTDFWPLLSMTKLSCFSDILFPAQYYYRLSRWSPKMGANDVPWADKKSLLYWRGASTGGRIRSTPTGSNHHLFPRFRFLTLAKNNTSLMDVRMTSFAHEYCKTDDGCHFTPIVIQYSIFGPKAPRREALGYKYLLDIDGNTFSGRFLGLLRSGSLVFKATVYQEFFNDWLRPYEHFIPVKYDLSDLVQKVEWAQAHDDEARRIQETGKLFADKLMTDAQNDCYMALVLLEWARLYNET
uniref:Glycosyl transferase CAP10 domain-containing protein n=1 Tax=Mycena chlorophos TaxID=658473 RepID=A0ABQ0LNP6_MYCCL|nr:predicted protein [Mycena chlorophos]